LACRKIDEITFFQWGKVYVMDTRQGALVKKVFPDNNNPDNILCVSENKEDFPPFTLPKTEIRSISIVVGVIGVE
jgi:phage repressor protein C with HTH and peptisase S24 domain